MPRTTISQGLNRLRKVRRIMEKVPPCKIDMNSLHGTFPKGCGCAIYHAKLAGMKISAGDWDKFFGITKNVRDMIFANNTCEYGWQATGDRAKKEFMKRITAAIDRKAKALKKQRAA